MATSLPPEMIVNILCRLTVKDLLRFRSVSRTWRFLIDGPDFIKLHLNHSIKTSSNLGLVLNAGDFHWFDLDTLRWPERLNQLPISNDNDDDGILILGCCNGVLAIANWFGTMALWNPSTGGYIKWSFFDFIDVTKFPSSGKFCFGASGFGYDAVNDDYKLFRVVHFRDICLGSFPPQVKLYSVKAKAWKTISGLPMFYDGYHCGLGVSYNGALHWFVSKNPEYECSFLIVAFDLVTEDHREVPLPCYRDNFYARLGELGGWLSLVKNYKQHTNSNRVEIWIMREYGVQESWTLLFSVVPSKVTGSFSYVEPVAYLKSTNQVVLDLGGKKVVLYDLEKKRVKKLRISGVRKFSEARLCVRSLVGFDGGDGEKATGKQSGKDRNKKEAEEEASTGQGEAG